MSHWDEDEEFPVADWKHEVADDNTRQSYIGWVVSQREMQNEANGPSPVASKWRHLKRGTVYTVITVFDRMNTIVEDNDVFEILHNHGIVYQNVRVQMSNGIPDGPWWLYQSKEGKRFIRPASEFTPDRFEPVVRNHNPETCPSNHWNDGTDVCEDCGKELNA